MGQTYRIKKPAALAEIPHDNHAVIEASAGTGKTYTIEHMVVDLLLADDELRISQVLIVTFTERATQELTRRIRALLQGIVDADPKLLADGAEPAWEIGRDERLRLRRALSSFDLAPIHTIHGFCHRVLTENAFQHDRLFEQEHTDFDVLFDNVFKQALRREFAHRPEFEPYLAAWLEANDRAIDRLQTILSKCAQSRGELRPDFDEEALRELLETLAERHRGAFVSDLIAELESEGVHHATVRAVSSRMQTIFDGVDTYREDGDVTRFMALTSQKDVYEYMVEKLAENPFTGPCGRLVRRAFELVVPLEAAIVDQFLPTLERMLRDYKQKQGRFAYDDMLAFVWESLESDRGEALVELLRERYKFALIDEFQDTDDLQWKIFRRIFHDSERENIFYLIGDPKQAIYSFRGADVFTYLDATKTVIEAGGARVRLRKNWRSSKDVIAAYNHIFDERAEPSFFTGEIGYDAPVECALPQRALLDADGRPAHPVEIVQLVDEDLNSGKLRRGLAAHFAAEIARMLGDQTLQVREDKDSSPRPLLASDIFVLTRTRSEGRTFAEHLRREGVAYAFFKQDGLFQTPEAAHIYDLLCAVARPHDRSRRRQAWLTPFFDLELDELADADALSETEPLVGDLFDWKQMAEQRWFEGLFGSILRRSGLLRREIFTKTSERELTNYLHIFELLLEETHHAQLDIEDLAVRLKAFIDGHQSPEGADSNTQRVETEAEAVQIMTMHKAKGLEAEVVFVYGGFGRGPRGDTLAFHDDDGTPVLQIGTPPPGAKARWQRERREEEQRLMYVALTRAKSRLYLPYVGFEQDPDKRDYNINGPYSALLKRLDKITVETSSHFVLDRIEYAKTIRVRDVDAQLRAIATWRPPDALPEALDAAQFAPYRDRRHTVSSYSRIKAGRDSYLPRDIDVEEFKADAGQSIEALLAEGALPGGKRAGVFLHELVEQLDLDWARGQRSLQAWLADEALDAEFRACMRRYGVDPGYLDYCKELVHDAVTTQLGGPEALPAVVDCDHTLRELEFLYPIPERAHPAIDELPEGEFSIDRGYIKGFIDLLFEVDGKVYFADWKSDILAEYSATALDAHVAERYSIQATIYTLAVVKLLDVHNRRAFEERFGGYLYLFMRGMGEGDGHGIYFRQPTWSDVIGFENQLREQVRF